MKLHIAGVGVQCVIEPTGPLLQLTDTLQQDSQVGVQLQHPVIARQSVIEAARDARVDAADEMGVYFFRIELCPYLGNGDCFVDVLLDRVVVLGSHLEAVTLRQAIIVLQNGGKRLMSFRHSARHEVGVVEV